MEFKGGTIIIGSLLWDKSPRWRERPAREQDTKSSQKKRAYKHD